MQCEFCGSQMQPGSRHCPFCGLTKDEAEQLPDFSYTKQYEIIERGLSNYEIQ